GYSDDRGLRLEEAWRRGLGGALDVSYRELRGQERGGKYPSLIFSPMMVEDGRPLLISTLDLGSLVRTPEEADARKGFPAVESFKPWPEHGWDRQTGTAARLSATFPYLSPAVTIPTLPPRRLVDAGYYDNYGMDIALGWVGRASDPDVEKKPWVLTNYTSRV